MKPFLIFTTILTAPVVVVTLLSTRVPLDDYTTVDRAEVCASVPAACAVDVPEPITALAGRR
jgi:hypothetical protein